MFFYVCLRLGKRLLGLHHPSLPRAAAGAMGGRASLAANVVTFPASICRRPCLLVRWPAPHLLPPTFSLTIPPVRWSIPTTSRRRVGRQGCGRAF
jgi:hypothetical protein